MATQTLQYPLINGTKHDFSSIELKIAGQIFIGFKSINYSRTRTRVMVRGNSPDPIAKTLGTNEYTGECEVYLAEYDYLQSLLVQAAQQSPNLTGPGAGYGDVFFQVIVTYTDAGFNPVVDTLNGCTLDSLDSSNSQSADPLVRKFNLAPMKILFNGVDDLNNPLQAPV